MEFRDLNVLPTSIRFGGSTNAADFVANHASWNKSCHLKCNHSDELIKARKRKSKHVDDPEQRPSKRQAMKVDNCIFCVKGLEEGDLHQVSTFTVLRDTKLLSHIDGKDLIAKEAKYLLKCLTSLRSRYRSHFRKQNQDEEKAHTAEENTNISRVCVELVSYIEKICNSGTSLFIL